MPDFGSVVRPSLEGALESGETLEGICAAAQQSALQLGGGDAQRLGIEALARWFQRFARQD